LLEELAKRFLNGSEVGVDVGVVEFDVVENDQFGEVLKEFAAFISKGGVVLVALEDPEGAGSVVAPGGEVEWDATDKPAGVKASFFEKEGQHG
jgi:hypothetical protein